MSWSKQTPRSDYPPISASDDLISRAQLTNDSLLLELCALLRQSSWKLQTKQLRRVVQCISTYSLEASPDCLITFREITVPLITDMFYRQENRDIRKSLLQIIGHLDKVATSVGLSTFLKDVFIDGFTRMLGHYTQVSRLCQLELVLEATSLIATMSSFDLGSSVLMASKNVQLSLSLYTTWLEQAIARYESDHTEGVSLSATSSLVYNLLKALVTYFGYINHLSIKNLHLPLDILISLLRATISVLCSDISSEENKIVAAIVLLSTVLRSVSDRGERGRILGAMLGISNKITYIHATTSDFDKSNNVASVIALTLFSTEQRLLLARAIVSIGDYATLLEQVFTPEEGSVSILDAAFLQIYRELVPDSTIQLDVSLRVLAFETLAMWLDRTTEVSKGINVNGDDHTNCMSIAVKYSERLLTLVWMYYDEPPDVIRFRVKQLFVALVKFQANQLVNHDVNNGICELNALLIRLSTEDTYRKCKYGMLETLIPYVGSEQILKACPDIVRQSLEALGHMNLAGKVSSFLRVLLAHYQKWCIEHYDNEVLARSAYHDAFLSTIVECLISRHDTLAKHVASHILPILLTADDDTLPKLLVALQERNDFKDIQVRALLSVFRVARSLNIASEHLLVNKYITETTLLDTLSTASTATRLDLLGIIAENKKVAGPFSDTELRLLKAFVWANISDPDAAFRMIMYRLLERSMIRLRNSLYTVYRELTQAQQLLNKKGHLMSTDELATVKDVITSKHASIESAQTFLTWLVSFCVTCLFPGASYARLLSSLYVLTRFAQVFGIMSVPMPTGFVAEHCTAPKFPFDMSMFLRNEWVIRALLEQIASSYKIMRTSALELLLLMPHPLPGIELNILVSQSMKKLESWRSTESENGALLVRLIVRCYILDGNITVHIPDVECCNHYSIPLLIYASSLVQLLERQTRSVQVDLMRAAQDDPAHGTLMALAHIFSELDFTSTSYHSYIDEWKALTVEIIRLSRILCETVAHVLCNQSPEGNIPYDYRQMEEAIDMLMTETNMEDDDRASTSQQILSFAWRVVKEASGLIGSLVMHTPLPSCTTGPKTLLSFEQILSLGDMLRELMTSVRHRGAFSSIYPSFVGLCTRLLESSHPSLVDIPRKWLTQTLNIIRDPDGASITRRSAGLPYIVLALVGSDASRKLCMPVAFQTLYSISADEDIQQGYDSTTEHPLVHAFNTLRRLFEDSKLSSDVRSYIADGIALSIDKLSSPDWAVRNGALMLFTSLVNRIFGSTNRCDERCDIKKITAKEFFHRYPKLHGILLTNLQTAVDTAEQPVSQLHLPRSLYPVLILLSRLHPSPLDVANQMYSMSLFVPLVQRCSQSAVWKVRETAAKAIAPLITAEEVSLLVCALIADASIENQNELHGKLLQASAIIDTHIHFLSTAAKIDLLVRLGPTLLTRFSELVIGNNCPLTQAAYLFLVKQYLNAAELDSHITTEISLSFYQLITSYRDSMLLVDIIPMNEHLLYTVYEVITSILLKPIWTTCSESRVTQSDDMIFSELMLSLASKHYETQHSALRALLEFSRTEDVGIIQRYSHVLEEIQKIVYNASSPVLSTVRTNESLTLALQILAVLPVTASLTSYDQNVALWPTIALLVTTEHIADSIVEASIVFLGSLVESFICADPSVSIHISTLQKDWCNEYLDVIDRYSHEDMPLAFREAAAQSLRRCARLLFAPNTRDLEVSIALQFIVWRRFLQDDDADLRLFVCEKMVSKFLAKGPVTCAKAIVLMYKQLERIASSDAHVALIIQRHMLAVLWPDISIESVLYDVIASEQTLFAKEASNMYKETIVELQVAACWLVTYPLSDTQRDELERALSSLERSLCRLADSHRALLCRPALYVFLYRAVLLRVVVLGDTSRQDLRGIHAHTDQLLRDGWHGSALGWETV